MTTPSAVANPDAWKAALTEPRAVQFLGDAPQMRAMALEPRDMISGPRFIRMPLLTSWASS